MGKETTINILDAQAETFYARIEATFDRHVAVYPPLPAMGRLGPAVFNTQ